MLERHKVGLPSLVGHDCRVLILGTLPGDKSIARQQYYGHPRNLFWRLIATYIGDHILTEPYADREEILHAYGIGLWDVMHRAERIGSLDSNIRHGELNDLTGLFARYLTIQHIGFNGQSSANIFQKRILPGLIEAGGFTKTMTTLPSSSPANAGVSHHAKATAWFSFLQRSLA
jgi:hypoxanthine-DNA glycosylase